MDPTNGVLIVARLDGPSAAIARGLVDKALAAETNGLWGRAYFDLRNTPVPRLKPGDDWIRTASEICRRLGFETVVDEQEATFPAGFPMSHIALYLGWYDESVSGPLAQPTVEFMPGAFAYHLHSFSACSLRVTNRYWVGPLLAKGATITMGCVAEPYLEFTPDLAVFVSRLLYSGFSFGEAAYVCQRALSWQTTVVGDPLYRPFGRNLDELLLELEARDSPWRPWAYLRLLDLNLANGKPPVEVRGLSRRTPVDPPQRGAFRETGGPLCGAGQAFFRRSCLRPGAGPGSLPGTTRAPEAHPGRETGRSGSPGRGLRGLPQAARGGPCAIRINLPSTVVFWPWRGNSTSGPRPSITRPP